MISLLRAPIIGLGLAGLLPPPAEAQFTPVPTRPVRASAPKIEPEPPTIKGEIQADHPTSAAVSQLKSTFENKAGLPQKERFSATAKILEHLADKVEKGVIRDPQELSKIAFCIMYEVYIRPGNAHNELSEGGDQVVLSGLRLNGAIVRAARKANGIKDPFDQRDHYGLMHDLSHWHNTYLFNNAVAAAAVKTYVDLYINPNEVVSLSEALDGASTADQIATRAVVSRSTSIVTCLKNALAERKRFAWERDRTEQTAIVLKVMKRFDELTHGATFPNECQHYAKALKDARAEIATIINDVLCADLKTMLRRPLSIEECKLGGEILALGLRYQSKERERFCDIVGDLGFAEGAARERLPRYRDGYGESTPSSTELLLDSSVIAFVADSQTIKKYVEKGVDDPHVARRIQGNMVSIYLFVRELLPPDSSFDVRATIGFHFESTLENGSYVKRFGDDPAECGRHSAVYLVGFVDPQVDPKLNKQLARGVERLRSALKKDGVEFKALKGEPERTASDFLEGYRSATLNHFPKNHSFALTSLGVPPDRVSKLFASGFKTAR